MQQSFLKLVEETYSKEPKELYKALKWSRQRYFMQRGRATFPHHELPSLRSAVGASVSQFYSLFEKFIESV